MRVPSTLAPRSRRRARSGARVALSAVAALLFALGAGPVRSGADAAAPEVPGAPGHGAEGPSCRAVPPERTATAAGILLQGLSARAGTAGPGDTSGTVSLNTRGYNYGPGRVAAAPERGAAGR